jgi:hypothetical protein
LVLIKKKMKYPISINLMRIDYSKSLTRAF